MNERFSYLLIFLIHDKIMIVDILNANKALQPTNTALASFSIRLSHNGLVPRQGALPVVTAQCWRLKASVSHLPYYERILCCCPSLEVDVEYNCVFVLMITT